MIEPYYADSMIRLFNCDVLEGLAQLPDESVHAVVTSPPYWSLRDYGVPGQLGLETTPGEYLEHMVAVFAEVRRVLRKDGVCWVNIGDSYAAGGTGGCSPKSTLHDGKGVADTEKLRQMKQETRQAPPGLKTKDLCLIPQRLSIALQADGWWVRSMIPWIKRSPMPESVTDRPTNALEYVLMLTKSARYYFDMQAVRIGFVDVRMGNPGGGGQWARDCPYPNRRIDQQSGLQRGVWNETGVHAGRAFRNSDLWFQSVDSPHGLVGIGDELVGLDVTSDPTKYAHFATYPRALVKPFVKCSTSEKGCCPNCGAGWRRVVEKGEQIACGHGDSKKYQKLGRSPSSVFRTGTASERQDNGFAPSCTCGCEEVVPATVLDLFSGSGTTLTVARDLGRRSVGIELSEPYAEMCVKYRILGAPYKPEDTPLDLREEAVPQARQLSMEEESDELLPMERR
ncbi:MAG: site-specific DNA-methyltransferase [Dehalococcoidia bacterium]|nr:site-specific DNA-methyltransferase [Dehalococcoidia bacterium]